MSRSIQNLTLAVATFAVLSTVAASVEACGGRGGWLPEEIRESNITPTYRWFVKNGIILIKSTDGQKHYRRKICRKRGKYYWTDADTKKASSRIMRSSRGNKLTAGRYATTKKNSEKQFE